MPLTTYQKKWVLEQSGYNPEDYDVQDDGSIIPKNKLQPSVSDNTFQSKVAPKEVATEPPFGFTGTAFGTVAHNIPSGVAAGLAFTKARNVFNASKLGAKVPGPPWVKGAAGLTTGVLAATGAGGVTSWLQRQAEQPFVKAALDVSSAVDPSTGASIGSTGSTMAKLGKLLRNLQESQAKQPGATLTGDIASIPFSGVNPSPRNLIKAGGSVVGRALGKSIPKEDIPNLVNVGVGAALQPAIATGRSLASGEGIPSVGELVKEALLGGTFSKVNRLGRAYGMHGDTTARSPLPGLEETLPVTSSEIEATPKQLTPGETVSAGGVPMTKGYAPKAKLTEAGLRKLARVTEGDPVTRRPEELGVSPEETARLEAEGGKEREILEGKEGELVLMEREKNQQDIRALERAYNELQRQKAAEAQSEHAGSVLELAETLRKGQIAARPEVRTKPIATTELGKEIFPDYTGVKEQGVTEAAAESPADLAARQEEARLAKKQKPKFQEKSAFDPENPTTPFEKETADKYKRLGRKANLPIWFDMLKKWGAKFRNVDLKADDTIVNNKGEPVAGQAVLSEGLETATAKVNPAKMGAETMPHELFHVFIDFLSKSPRKGDIKVTGDFNNIVKNDPGYKEWAAARRKAGYEYDVNEFITTEQGAEFLRRQLNLEEETPFKIWYKDLAAHVKTRFTKDATLADYRRLLQYRFQNDAAFSDYFKTGKLHTVGKGGELTSAQEEEKERILSNMEEEVGATPPPVSKFSEKSEFGEGDIKNIHEQKALKAQQEFIDKHKELKEKALAIYKHSDETALQHAEEVKGDKFKYREIYRKVLEGNASPETVEIVSKNLFSNDGEAMNALLTIKNYNEYLSQLRSFTDKKSGENKSLKKFNSEKSNFPGGEEEPASKESLESLAAKFSEKEKKELTQPRHDSVIKLLDFAAKGTDDASISDEDAAEIHTKLRDEVDWERSPRIHEALSSKDFDPLDPDHWNDLRRFYNADIFEPVEKTKQAPTKVLPTKESIPEKVTPKEPVAEKIKEVKEPSVKTRKESNIEKRPDETMTEFDKRRDREIREDRASRSKYELGQLKPEYINEKELPGLAALAKKVNTRSPETRKLSLDLAKAEWDSIDKVKTKLQAEKMLDQIYKDYQRQIDFGTEHASNRMSVLRMQASVLRGRYPSISEHPELKFSEKSAFEGERLKKENYSKERDLDTEIKNWLLNGGEMPKAPAFIYRGIPQGASQDFTPNYEHFQHGSPWLNIAKKGGKYGGYFDVYKYPVGNDQLYFRGGALEGDPLESTRVGSLRGYTWEKALNRAKQLFERDWRKYKARTDYEITDKEMLDVGREIVDNILHNLKRGTFETDVLNKYGKYTTGTPAPRGLKGITPRLRTRDEIAQYEKEMGDSRYSEESSFQPDKNYKKYPKTLRLLEKEYNEAKDALKRLDVEAVGEVIIDEDTGLTMSINAAKKKYPHAAKEIDRFSDAVFNFRDLASNDIDAFETAARLQKKEGPEQPDAFTKEQREIGEKEFSKVHKDKFIAEYDLFDEVRNAISKKEKSKISGDRFDNDAIINFLTNDKKSFRRLMGDYDASEYIDKYNKLVESPEYLQAKQFDTLAESPSVIRRNSIFSSFRNPVKGEIQKIEDLSHPKSNKVSKAFTGFYEQFDKYRGRFTNDIVRKLEKFIDYTNPKEAFLLNNKDMDAVVNYLYDMQDKGASSINLTARQIAIEKAVRENLLATAKEKNTFSTLPKTITDPKYLPQIPSRKALKIFLNEQGTPQHRALMKDWYDYYQKVKHLSKEEADQALKVFKAGYEKQEVDLANQFGPVDKSAGIGIPRSWRENNLMDIMQRFNNRYARRLAFHKTIETNKEVQDALHDPAEGLVAAEPVKIVAEDIAGVREHEEATRTAVAGLVRAGMMQTLTGEKDFGSNLTLGFQHQDPIQAIKSPLYAWSKMKQHIAESFAAGKNRSNSASIELGQGGFDDAISFTRRLRDIVNTTTGRNHLERWTRATAFGQGKFLGMDNLWNAHKGRLSNQGRKFLDDFGPENWRDYREKGEFPTEILEDIASRYVDSVQGTYDYRGLPRYTQRGSLAPVLSLARWNVEKFNNFMKYNIEPAKKGNYTPLLMSTLGMLIGGTAVTAIVEATTGRKSKTPTIKEIETLAGEGKNITMPIAYKLAGLSSMAGYAGIMGDIIKSALDYGYGKTKPQIYDNPLLIGVHAIAENAADAVEALTKGELDMGSFIDITSQVLEDTFQTYRLAFPYINAEKKEDIERANKLRDQKLFKITHGYPVSGTTGERENPFLNKDIKEFKRTKDVNRAVELLPGIISKAIKDSEGDYDKLKTKLNSIKENSYQTMPSPDRTLGTFKKYYEFLIKTQGQEEADKRLEDYLKTNLINKTKAELVPDI